MGFFSMLYLSYWYPGGVESGGFFEKPTEDREKNHPWKSARIWDISSSVTILFQLQVQETSGIHLSG